jgi:hypothetical protein
MIGGPVKAVVLLTCCVLVGCNFYYRKNNRSDLRDCTASSRADGSVVVSCPGGSNQVFPSDSQITICQNVNGYTTKVYQVPDFVNTVLGKADYYLGTCQ